MKFTATTQTYNPDTGMYDAAEVEFFDVKSYEFKDGFCVITKNNGDIHATANTVKTFSFTQE